MATVSDKLTAVVSAEGQVVLPEALRARRRWVAGTRLTIEETADGVVLKPAPLFPPKAVDEVFGSLKPYYDGPPLSLDDMDRAVETEARRRARD